MNRNFGRTSLLLGLLLACEPPAQPPASPTGAAGGDAHPASHAGHSPSPTGIRLTATQRLTANVQVAPVTWGELRTGKRLTGVLTVNQNRVTDVSARFPGRVERLHVRAVGERIRVGQPLYDVYGEGLAVAQQEYLHWLERVSLGGEASNLSLLQSARNRLLLWGMTSGQLDELARSRVVRPTMTVHSPVAGTVTELVLREGMYLGEGTRTVQVADLYTLWVQAQVYAGEAGQVRLNDPVEVQLPAFPDRVIRGRVAFVNPELTPSSNIVLVRIEIANPAGQFRPGMQAEVGWQNALKRGLIVPANAVLRDSQGAMVFVQEADGAFRPRMVQTGLETEQRIEITGGVRAGERLVTSGAYLLKSELLLQQGPAGGHTGH